MTAPSVSPSRVSTLHVVQGQREVAAIRVDAVAMGRAHGLDAATVDRLGIVVTEVAGNIARHAGGGHIILRAVGEQGTGCIEILALDKGPGISDMARVMREDATPAGGVPRDGGLSAIRRLADLFDIYSHPGRGTALVAHVGAPPGDDEKSRCVAETARHGCIGAVCVPLRGEDACGDDWVVDVVDGRTVIMLVDGLGHGPEAAIAARAAMTLFPGVTGKTPEIMLGELHAALRHTRGAALSVTVLDQVRHTARFCGVGNVDGRIATPDLNHHLVPQNGIVGHAMPRVHADDVPWPTAGRLVMHSDGISSRWRAEAYPGLLARHPALLAGVLFRDFARARDDATVLVVRDSIPPSPA